MRYRFRCEYLGSAFYGWQVQNEAGKQKFVTVQSALEEALSIALRSPVHIVGSGRTDNAGSAPTLITMASWIYARRSAL